MEEHDLSAKVVKNEGIHTTASSWFNWCRLCAKRNEDGHENSKIFRDMNSTLTTSIGKYFWVNIKPEDEIPKSLCRECEQLIDELVVFTERINKVQTMYCLLQNLKPTSVDEANKLRSQFGVADEGWDHIIKVEKKPPQKPDVANREVQTDLVIFFNNHSHEDKQYKHSPFANEDSVKLDKKQAPQNVDELVVDIDQEQEQTYEYVLNDDNDEIEVNTITYSKDDIKFKLGTVSTEADEDVEIEDSDLFKELKFKAEENEESAQRDRSHEKKLRLEIQQMRDNSDPETTELLNEDLNEDGDEDDYIEILDFKTEHNASESVSNAYDSLPKRKRGRPINSFKSEGPIYNSPYRYSCPDCDRKYKNPTIFRKHMSTNHGVVVGELPGFLCPVCSNDCITESALKKHMRKHLPDDEKFTVSCPFCDKKFSQESAMRQHVNGIHHQMKPFICDQCGRACKTLAALNEHQLVHTNECPFICDVCKKGFKNKARLKSHMDTHTESDYTCPDCNLKLNTKRTLLQHRLVHSNIKRFKCHFCDAAFKRSKALKNHLILHSGLRPYKCPFCEKSFSNGSNCRSHKKRAHPQELAHEEALGIKNEPAPIPKLEDLKAAKGIVQPRKVKRHAGVSPDHCRKLLKSSERCKKQGGDDFDDASGEEDYEITDIQYEIEGELDDDDDMAEGSQDFVDDCEEETVIYEIIGEV